MLFLHRIIPYHTVLDLKAGQAWHCTMLRCVVLSPANQTIFISFRVWIVEAAYLLLPFARLALASGWQAYNAAKEQFTRILPSRAVPAALKNCNPCLCIRHHS
jgi:hypothetical protein